jgi:hypothetical protein
MTGTVVKIENCKQYNFSLLPLGGTRRVWHDDVMKFVAEYTSIAMSVRPSQPDDVRMLAARRTVRIAVPDAGCCVYCISGTIWLTEGTGGRDHIMRRGESRDVSARGASVLWAVEDAAYRCVVTVPKKYVRVGFLARRMKAAVAGLFRRREKRIVRKVQ